jgi:hypothetical protein
MILIQEEKMKRFWLMMLSMGLIMAFNVSAHAVDVKVSGEYYVAGMYLNKTSLSADAQTNPSTAFYYQRLRVRTDFVVSQGLTLITRFDALERVWGGQRSAPGTTLATGSAETLAEKQNIAFDWAYIDYVSPIGTFDIGMMNDGETGTIFGNSYAPLGRIKWNNTFGLFTLKADITKAKDQSYSVVTSTATYTDADDDKYGLEGVYQWKDGRAGMKVTYYRYADSEPTSNYRKTYFKFEPYAIAQIGPVDIQAEINYATGTLQEYDKPSTTTDVKLDNLSGWIDATANLGITYFGGTIAYVSGDDPNTKDRQEGGTLNGGTEWNPCLILFNYYDRTYWVGALAGNATSSNSGPMSNAWFYQGRIGVKPVANLDIKASISYANVDKKPAGFVGGTYGTEVDFTGTYKITNNLSYILGAGYLFAGDYYKGTDGNSHVGDDYMLINKLTLTF